MITVTDLSLRFSDKKLFEDVNAKFTPGNCYVSSVQTGRARRVCPHFAGIRSPLRHRDDHPGERLATLNRTI
jgi:hypothetical protein